MSDMESKVQVVIDRIEEDRIAVVELPDLTQFEIDKNFLPKKVKEGNVLDMIFQINFEEEKRRREEIIKLQEELLNRSKEM